MDEEGDAGRVVSQLARRPSSILRNSSETRADVCVTNRRVGNARNKGGHRRTIKCEPRGRAAGNVRITHAVTCPYTRLSSLQCELSTTNARGKIHSFVTMGTVAEWATPSESHARISPTLDPRDRGRRQAIAPTPRSALFAWADAPKSPDSSGHRTDTGRSVGGRRAHSLRRSCTNSRKEALRLRRCRAWRG